jgi:OAH_OAS_sulfhy: O-acetylhomoserine aminocarboxypropyltransferase/cysteine synthase
LYGARSRSTGTTGQTLRRALRRGQYVRCRGLPVQPLRMGCEHRRRLGDQMDQRPRHGHGRGDRRRGQLQLGQRQVPADRRPVGRVSRTEFPRGIRRGGLHREMPRGRCPRPGLLPLAVRLLPDDARAGNAFAARAARSRVGTQAGRILPQPSQSGARELRRLRVAPELREREEVFPVRFVGRLHHRTQRHARQHRAFRRIAQPGGTHGHDRRLGHGRYAPGIDHAQTAQRRRPRRSRRHADHAAHLRRAGEYRRPYRRLRTGFRTHRI